MNSKKLAVTALVALILFCLCRVISCAGANTNTYKVILTDGYETCIIENASVEVRNTEVYINKELVENASVTFDKRTCSIKVNCNINKLKERLIQ